MTVVAWSEIISFSGWNPLHFIYLTVIVTEIIWIEDARLVKGCVVVSSARPAHWVEMSAPGHGNSWRGEGLNKEQKTHILVTTRRLSWNLYIIKLVLWGVHCVLLHSSVHGCVLWGRDSSLVRRGELTMAANAPQCRSCQGSLHRMWSRAWLDNLY